MPTSFLVIVTDHLHNDPSQIDVEELCAVIYPDNAYSTLQISTAKVTPLQPEVDVIVYAVTFPEDATPVGAFLYPQDLTLISAYTKLVNIIQDGIISANYHKRLEKWVTKANFSTVAMAQMGILPEYEEVV